MATTDIWVVQAITELVLEGLPSDGLELDHDCTITPNHNDVLRFVDSPFDEFGQTIRMVIGQVERDVLAGASAVTFVVQVSDHRLTDEEARRFLMRVMALTQLFLLCLWLIRDNSGNGGQGIIALGDPGVGTIRSVFTQRPGLTNFTSRCDKHVERFSRQEIDQAVRYFRLLDEFVLPQVEWRLDAPRPTGLIYTSRIFRTIYFTEAARGMADVGVRALYYSMAFEALLAAESGRYSHNVPRRASQVLGTTKKERQQPYNDIFGLYGVRSDVVHGSSFGEARLDEIRQTTERCDGYLRTVLTTILNNEVLLKLFREGSNRAIGKHFNDEPPDELPDRARHPVGGEKP